VLSKRQVSSNRKTKQKNYENKLDFHLSNFYLSKPDGDWDGASDAGHGQSGASGHGGRVGDTQGGGGRARKKQRRNLQNVVVQRAFAVKKAGSCKKMATLQESKDIFLLFFTCIKTGRLKLLNFVEAFLIIVIIEGEISSLFSLITAKLSGDVANISKR
jgi:hypothetical protein